MFHPFDTIDMFISRQDIKIGLLFKLFFIKLYIPFNIPISSIKQFVSGSLFQVDPSESLTYLEKMVINYR